MGKGVSRGLPPGGASPLTATSAPRKQRWASRYALWAELWGITSVDRVRYCGRRRSKRDEAPQVKVQGGVAHFARLMLCGRVWVCPVCGPRIRQERAAELDGALATWLEQHGEGSVILATYTLPHVAAERLGALLALVRDAFSGFTSGEQWAKLRADFGLVGYVRAHDATHGANGWHPHLHVVYVAEQPVSPEQVEAMHARQFTLWRNVVTRLGHRSPVPEALSIEVARRREDVARYALQVVSGDAEAEGGRLSSVALELARGDLKTGRRDGQRTPWEILIGATRRISDADGVLDEDAERARDRDRVLWREWETCTKGVHAVQWSRGLRGMIGLGAEQSDEEVVAVEVGGEVVYEFTDRLAWLAVCDVRGGQVRVLRAAERWGARGCVRIVAALVRRWHRERAKLGVLGGVGSQHREQWQGTEQDAEQRAGQDGSEVARERHHSRAGVVCSSHTLRIRHMHTMHNTHTGGTEDYEYAAQVEASAERRGSSPAEHSGRAVVEHRGADARTDDHGDSAGRAGCGLQLSTWDERGGCAGDHQRIPR